MASVRNIVSFQELYSETVTFKYGADITYDSSKNLGSNKVGLAVQISASQTVNLTTDASHVAGKLVYVTDDGFCTVQTGGYAFLPKGDSVTLTFGKKIVGAVGASSAKGYIRDVAAATLAEVAVARGLTVDVSTAANTLVDGTFVAGAAVLLD